MRRHLWLGVAVARRAVRRRVDGHIGRRDESEAFLLGPGQSPQGTVDSVANDIVYHGGNAGDGAIGVEIKPAVYLIYWGPQWATGFTTNDTNGTPYSSKTLQTYLNTFFAGVGGSPWAGVQTQYCRGVPLGTTSCAGPGC